MKNKKIISLVCIFFLILSCSILMAFKDADSNTQCVRSNWVSDCDKTTYVIESQQQLLEYFNGNKHRHGLGKRGENSTSKNRRFEEVISKYDEQFFEENNLVLILLNSNSGSIKYNVDSYKIIDGVMNVTISEKRPEYMTCDMAGWHIIIETDKVEINSVNVNIE